MNKKTKHIVYILAVLVLITPIVGHYLAKTSEPYLFATKFINDNDVILKEFGDIQSQSLSFFGYSVKYTGPNGEASFNILLIGITGLSGDIHLDLVKEVGAWQVTKANLIKIDGSVINIK